MTSSEHTEHTEHPPHREESLRTYFTVFIILMILLVLTVVAYEIDFSRWHIGFMNLLIAMVIAIIKAVLVILIFMHVRVSSKLVWVFASAAFLWLSIMIVGTLHDYATRPMDAAYAHTFFSNTPAAVAFEHKQ